MIRKSIFAAILVLFLSGCANASDYISPADYYVSGKVLVDCRHKYESHQLMYYRENASKYVYRDGTMSLNIFIIEDVVGEKHVLNQDEIANYSCSQYTHTNLPR